MSSKKSDVSFVSLHTEAQWKEALSKQNLIIIDAYSKWAGPCEALYSTFRSLKHIHGEKVDFYSAQVDDIAVLEKYKDTSVPQILFYIHQTLVGYVKGANAPLIGKEIKGHLDMEAKGVAPIPIGEGADSAAVPKRPYSVKQATSVHHILDVENTEKTLAIIKPDAMRPYIIEQIFEMIKLNRMEIIQEKKCWISKSVAEEFYDDHKYQPFYNQLVNFLSSGPILALVIAKEDAIKTFRKLMGPASVQKAKEEFPKSIRAQFGTDNLVNAIYGSESTEAYTKVYNLIFDATNKDIVNLESTVLGSTSTPQKTVVLIKPDIANQSSKVEEIIQRLMWRGMQIYKREELVLADDEANRIYSERGNPESIAFVASGPVLVLVIKGENAIEVVKESLGPEDPDEARQRVPMSLRALFGTDLVHNALDCSMGVDEASQQIQILFPGLGQRHSMNSLNGSLGRLVSARNISESGKPGVNSKQASFDQLAEVAAVVAAVVRLERTLALIKPDAYCAGLKDAILARIKEEHFAILKEKEIQLTLEQAQNFYAEHHGKPFYDTLTTWMSSSPIYAMVLERENAVSEWRQLAGPTNSVKAREEAPNSLRALYGTDGAHNAVHGSDSSSSAIREAYLIFEAPPPDIQPKAENAVAQETSGAEAKQASKTPLAIPESEITQEIIQEITQEITQDPQSESQSDPHSESPQAPIEELPKSIQSSKASLVKTPSAKLAGSANHLDKTPSKTFSKIELQKAKSQVEFKPESRRASMAASASNLAKTPSNLAKTPSNLAKTSSAASIKDPKIASKPASRIVSLAGSKANLAASPSKLALASAAEKAPSKPVSRTVSKLSLKDETA